MDWVALLDYVGRPAILKPFSGGGWKHVYKVNNEEELLQAYDKTSPYCMTLQEFIDFEQYVRCFTFGKTDILPVAYDPKERRYLVEHNYLTPELGARVVKDAQTINLALGYEMNTIEFAVKDGVPYAIDFLNPAPDFERDRITEFYFEHVVEKMARLVIDRALHGNVANTWPRWEEMLGIGAPAGFTGAPRTVQSAQAAPAAPASSVRAMKAAKTRATGSSDPVEYWDELLRPLVKKSPDLAKKFLEEVRAAKLTFGKRVHCPFLRPCFSVARRMRARAKCGGDNCGGGRARDQRGARRIIPFRTISFAAGGRATGADDDGLWAGKHGFASGRVPAAGIVEVHGIQRRIAGRSGIFGNAFGHIPRTAGDGGIQEAFRSAQLSADAPNCWMRW